MHVDLVDQEFDLCLELGRQDDLRDCGVLLEGVWIGNSGVAPPKLVCSSEDDGAPLMACTESGCKVGNLNPT